jgi:hypothetical protein
LFFPEERQCVIIELKDPKVGLSENAHQMDKYAELIANFVGSDFPVENMKFLMNSIFFPLFISNRSPYFL